MFLWIRPYIMVPTLPSALFFFVLETSTIYTAIFKLL